MASDTCTEAGFRYRMIYLDSALIQSVLGGKSLPFIPGGLSWDARLFQAAETCLFEIGSGLPGLALFSRHKKTAYLSVSRF